MAARIIDGTAVARDIRAEVAAEAAQLRAEGTVPGLAVVLVGSDPASEVYVRSKTRACHEAGMHSRLVQLPAHTTADELFGTIDGLNADPGIHGMLIQLPLPSHLNPKTFLERVNPAKDVDGFHPMNVGRAFVGDPNGFVPATPEGIMELLRRERIDTHGKHAVIVGRSLIVSKPLASLLMAPGPNATVTLCHRHTVDLAQHTRMADILVVAVGKPGLITAEMVKPGAAVFDVGVTRVDDPDAPKGYVIKGDVDFDGVSRVASAITPVPGRRGADDHRDAAAQHHHRGAPGARPGPPPHAGRRAVTWDLFSAAAAASKPEPLNETRNEDMARLVAAQQADAGFPDDPIEAVVELETPAEPGILGLLPVKAKRGKRSASKAQAEAPEGGWTPSTLNSAARHLIEGMFPALWVSGEVSNFTRARSGHCYFSLRDRDAQIRCVMWRDEAKRLPTQPAEGMEVRVLGRLTIYEGRGEFQLVVSELEAKGEGLFKLAIDRLRVKLETEGLTSPHRKRPIPAHPACVGVVTSSAGAALRDVISVIRRRAPWTRIVLSAARVQGEGAAAEIAAAIRRIGAAGCADVLIVGRGGGSIEDLWAFNEEVVARAIAESPVPVISAVGHETDFTIADLVADLRAPTPSAAAEAAVPDANAVRRELQDLRERMARCTPRAGGARPRDAVRHAPGPARRRPAAGPPPPRAGGLARRPAARAVAAFHARSRLRRSAGPRRPRPAPHRRLRAGGELPAACGGRDGGGAGGGEVRRIRRRLSVSAGSESAPSARLGSHLPRNCRGRLGLPMGRCVVARAGSSPDTAGEV